MNDDPAFAGAGPASSFVVMISITEFGAKGDGTTLNTGAINQAIGACAGRGGGTVILPAGVYLSGTIRLLDQVTLQLEAGAVLKASADLSDYEVLPYKSEGRNTAFILADGVSNVSIAGRGTIDGNGMAFGRPELADRSRDFVAAATRQGERYNEINDVPDDGPIVHWSRPGLLILFKHCRDVVVTGVKIIDAPNWCLHVACCEDVRLSGLLINSSLVMPNSDGIDVSLSRRVCISDCTISAGDDGIAFSPCADGFGEGVAEDITVQNCVIESRSAAIRIGWGEHDFRNFLFQNIIIRNSNRGIGLFVRGAENISNIVFSNVLIETRLYKGKWWGKAEPVHMSVLAMDDGVPVSGRISGVSFNHVRITGEQGIVMRGHAPAAINDVSFRDVAMQLKTGPLQESFGGNFDCRPVAEVSRKVFAHVIAGLHASGVSRFTLADFRVTGAPGLPAYFEHALEIEHFDDVALESVRVTALGQSDAAICLRDGRRAALHSVEISGATSPGWQAERVEGLSAESIRVAGVQTES